MWLSQIGEFGLIERFKKQIRLDASVIKGPGDDCAVLKFDKDNYLLFTCDMLIEGVDFFKGSPAYLVGRKSIAVSVSDIASCGGIPRYCLVSLGLPKKTPLKYVDRLFKGMQGILNKYKINLVGGDLSQGRQVTIDVSMLGKVEKRNLVLRSGAKEGDVIYVSGSLGGSIRGRHLTFFPRLKEARALVKNFKINAMLDISDGLTQDLGHILKESGCGGIIYADLIPISKDARSLNEALSMGEDFELLFTLSRREAKRLSLMRAHNFKPIGEIVDEQYGLRLVDRAGRERIIKAEGFRHF